MKVRSRQSVKRRLRKHIERLSLKMRRLHEKRQNLALAQQAVKIDGIDIVNLPGLEQDIRMLNCALFRVHTQLVRLGMLAYKWRYKI